MEGRSPSGRAGRASPEPASGLGHTATIPNASEQVRSLKERLRDEAIAFIGKAKRPKEIELFDLNRRFGVAFRDGELLIARERLKRGEIKLTDLTPPQRRALIDPAKLDLHALASGPIMDSNEIYLPAGKLSLAAAKAREAATILSCDRDRHREADETRSGLVERSDIEPGAVGNRPTSGASQ